MNRGWIMALMIAASGMGVLAAGGFARGDAPVATQPAADAPVVRLVQRIADAVGKLDLNQEQRKRVDSILDSARQKAQTIAQENQGLSFGERMQNVTPFLRDLRGQLSDVLTPDELKEMGQKLAPFLEQFRGGSLQRIRDALAQLGLSDEQRKQVSDVLAEADQKIAALQQSAAAGQDVGAESQQLRQDLRSKLMTILTPGQQQDLRDIFQQQMPQNAGDGMMGNAPAPVARPATASSDPKFAPGPEAGSRAPDFHVKTTNGRVYELSSFTGHILVVEFGSLSCPVFRDNVRAMEKLHAAMGNRAWMMVIYTRENFPEGDAAVQRNIDDGISLAQPTNMDAKIAQAQVAREKLNITLPVAVDSADDQMTRAYGGFPNGAVVVGRDGRIVAREQWTNADSLRRAIEQAQKLPPGQFQVKPSALDWQ